MDKLREEFEAWFKTTWNGIDLLQTIGDDATFQLGGDSKYFEDCVQHSWEAWQASSIPDGYAVVPKEPTEAMLDASRRRQWDQLSLPMEDMDMLKYKAMIEAVEKNDE